MALGNMARTSSRVTPMSSGRDGAPARRSRSASTRVGTSCARSRSVTSGHPVTSGRSRSASSVPARYLALVSRTA